ncbi:hypothetical protein MMC25_003869 [Agyrium rufum]|nr:hypothetical protein [Agyrium rufum]
MAERRLHLLALDGGGVRGLSSLMILQALMEIIDPDSPPKPCDYFDMIGGTGTGGLIAIMLGRLRMSIDECIDAYLSLSERIFRKKGHRVTIKGKIQGRFDSEELERAVKEVVTSKGFPEDALLKDASDAACKVFVCSTSQQTSKTVCLTSYKSPSGRSHLLKSVKIWEACRATSAASSFFDPIAIGPYEERFVDGATGANNPVGQLWDQAQQLWGPQPLESKVQCLISIGTGVPSLKSFPDDVLNIGGTLVAIATDTEQTAENFRRDKIFLDNTNRYFRFNVSHGLEEIGLEESSKKKEVAAATGWYVESQDVFKQMQACAYNVAGREYFGDYRIVFSLEGVPSVGKFVERSAEMSKLEKALLPKGLSSRQKVFVLHGLGGQGKTQLAVEFARLHHRRFSSVFWLDGRTEDTLKRSIASCASRIPKGQISETSRTYVTGTQTNLETVVKEVRDWLSHSENTTWLLIFDNVDREYSSFPADPDAYDVKSYFPSADQGAILITTRLAKMEQLGDSHPLGRVNRKQAEDIFQSCYKRRYDPNDSEHLLARLDGLPLAISQAGSYLQESGVMLGTYLGHYEQQWKELMESRDLTSAPLQDYPESVWTTWVISYNAIRDKDATAANLLLLWAFLDNNDLWYGLFAAACEKNPFLTKQLSEWIGGIASNELEFNKAIRLLRNYSLIEKVEDSASYATHPVVHRWAYHFQDEDTRVELAQLAIETVGWAAPPVSTRDYWIMQNRLLPHALMCSQWVSASEIERDLPRYDTKEIDSTESERKELVIGAIHRLGDLYVNQGKQAEAEKMYQRALQGKEKALGTEHTSTLNTVNNLGNLYQSQGKLAEAEKMYQRALQGYEKGLGAEHTSTLDTVNNLGVLYQSQGKLAEAEKMFEQALRGCKKVFGPHHSKCQKLEQEVTELHRRLLKKNRKALISKVAPAEQLNVELQEASASTHVPRAHEQEKPVSRKRRLWGKVKE